jgi:methyltransferase family protein
VSADPAEIERRFAAVAPWESRYEIEGRAYGGQRDCVNDGRVAEFLRLVPAPRSVLELGSFEGGHSAVLARAPSIERLVCLEGRAENIARARVAHELLGLAGRIRTEQADLDDPEPVLARLGTFDAADCAGLLYHLAQPWLLLRALAPRVGRLFLDTHVSATDHIALGGYRGSLYRELGLGDTQSGLQGWSFWPTPAALERMLADSGFRVVHRQDFPDQPNGPRTILLCEARERSATG